MSWLQDFLGLKKIKTPAVKPPEELAAMDEFESDAYLKDLMRKSGFEQTIITGRSTQQRPSSGYLGAQQASVPMQEASTPTAEADIRKTRRSANFPRGYGNLSADVVKRLERTMIG